MSSNHESTNEQQLDDISKSKEQAQEASAQENKQIKKRLYSIFFEDWRAKLAIVPSLVVGMSASIYYFLFAPFVSTLAKFLIDSTYDVMKEVKQLIIYFVIFIVIQVICKFIDSYCWVQVGSLMAVKLKRQLFSSILRSDVSFIDMNPIGNLITLLSEDTKTVEEAFGTSKGTQLTNISTFLTSSILIFVFSWRIGLIVIAMFVGTLCVSPFFVPCISKNAAQEYMHTAAMTTIAQETFSHFVTVRSFNQEDQMYIKFANESAQTKKHKSYVMTRITLMSLCIMVFFWSGLIGSIYYAAWMVLKGTYGLEIGDLFAVFGFIWTANMSLMTMQTAIGSEMKGITSGSRILNIINQESKVNFDNGMKIENFKGHIEFVNVSFKYPTRDVQVLKNVSFEALPGEITAIVGQSGCGKSTIIQLIERFYDVDEGQILIDGIDIKDIDPRWLHSHISLVSQDPTLFSASVVDNIKYGSRNSNELEVIEAAEVANSKKFIDKLPNKLNEVIGEKGHRLSGGQKQRIAIARAIIRDPVILLTDEATSSLDSKSEKKVQEALDKVMQNRTSIVVAHRLNTVKNADTIIVFDAGEIKEKGKHDQLIESKGVYFNLVKKQIELGLDPGSD